MLEPWLPASVSYLLLRQENGYLFNLSMPGLQYDFPEVSKMASLVPLIPSKRLLFLTSGILAIRAWHSRP